MATEKFVRMIDIIEELNTTPVEYRFIGSMNAVVLAVQLYDPKHGVRSDILYLHSTELTLSKELCSSAKVHLLLVEPDILYRTFDQLQDIFYTLVCKRNGLPLLEHDPDKPVFRRDISPRPYSAEVFLLDLLDEKHLYENTTDLLFDSLYGHPKEVLYIMNVTTLTDAAIEDLKDAVGAYTDHPCCGYHNAVICLVPRHFGEDLSINSFSGFLDFLLQNDLYVGLSNGFTSLLKTHTAYEQSLTALQIGFHMKKDLHFFRFEDFLIASLLQSSRNTCDLFDLVHPTVMQVYYYDQEHNTEYLLTLAAYILLQKSIQQAAAAIHIHRNTMIHRLEKLKNDFGLDFKDPRMTTKLHISVVIFSYFGVIDASDFQPRQ